MWYSFQRRPILAAPLIFGRQVILHEAQGLQRLADHFPESFSSVLQMLRPVTGKIVCSGVGKSGHVAQKIASTLSSTGRGAFFVHPTEGLHGDLGALGPQDALIAFSASGESVELVRFVQHSQVRCRIAVTTNPKSSLAFCSDGVLVLPPTDEACPLGLAPTTSSIMMLALGDALALTLCCLGQFTREQYKRLHPAGALGHKLLYVDQVMQKCPPLVTQATPTQEILTGMVASGVGCVGVLDSNGQLVRVFTSADVAALAQSDRPEGIPPLFISPKATLMEAGDQLRAHPGPCLWVRNPQTNDLIGILTPDAIARVSETAP